MNLQGKHIDPGPHNWPRDYYGRPMFKSMNVRYTYDGPVTGWTEGATSRRCLGVQPSKKFAVYHIRNIPAHYSRYDVVRKLRPWMPPTDDFSLDFDSPTWWARERVQIPVVLPVRDKEFISKSMEVPDA